MIGGGKGSNKRISFTNPYSQSKNFILSNNRNDLLQFKESHLEMKAKETRVIALRYVIVYPADILLQKYRFRRVTANVSLQIYSYRRITADVLLQMRHSGHRELTRLISSFRFMPALHTGAADVLIFINDDDDKNEETFCVKVTYLSESDED